METHCSDTVAHASSAATTGYSTPVPPLCRCPPLCPSLPPTFPAPRTSAAVAGFSGAELANVVNEAAFLAVRTGGDAVGLPELVEAVQRTRWVRCARCVWVSYCPCSVAGRVGCMPLPCGGCVGCVTGWMVDVSGGSQGFRCERVQLASCCLC